MLLNESVENLILEIGHDGSEKLWPHVPEPECYRGFNTQELIDIAYNRGFALMQIDASPWSVSLDTEEPKRIWTDSQEDARMIQYMNNTSGIIIGQVEGGARHACAWTKNLVYDPRGHIYDIDTNNVLQSVGDKEFYPLAVDQFLGLYRIRLDVESNLQQAGK
jgi:hypothetical protein